MIVYFAFVLSIALADAPVSATATDSLIVWNVGQGQWLTARTSEHCLHFDTGGEVAPWKLIEKACAQRENAAYFSHWDWDHLSFVRELQRRTRTLCVAARPGGTAKPQREKMIESIDECGAQYADVQEIGSAIHSSGPSAIIKSTASASSRTLYFRKSSRKKATSNSASRIFIFDDFLIPGDSTVREEDQWKEDTNLRRAKVLILGHHGSKTSTSSALLAKLINVRQAVASARHGKYGHPHPLVEMRLQMHGIALLRTEDWGSIVFERSKKPHLVGNTKPLR